MGCVWVVGSLNIDLVSRVHRFPAAGETVTGNSVERFPGGKGANQAVAAAAAGAVVRLIGRIGDDADGARYLAALRARSVDVTGVVVEPDCSSGYAFVLVDDQAENCIVVTPGANGRLHDSDVARLRPQAGDVVMLQLEVPMPVIEQAVAIANDARALVLLNLAPYRDVDPAVIAACDVVVVNEHEAELLAFTGIVPRSVVVTRGAEGATWDGRCAASRAEVVIDTTGAGDAFAGTLAAALAAGADRQSALELAVSAGSRAVAWRGAQGYTL